MSDRVTAPPLDDIIARAASLQERLAAGSPAAPPAPAAEGTASLLARWRDRAAGGDPQVFERRLAWDGWDLATVRRGLARACVSPSPWRETLREIQRTAVEAEPTEDHPIPFAALFIAHRRLARQCLERELAAMGAAADALADEVWQDLDRALTARLSSFAAETLAAAFDAFRGGAPHGMAVRLAEAGVRRETRLYCAFLAAQRDAGLLGPWPVLARLTATAVDLWVRNVAEMIRRWLADRGPIEDTFFATGPLLRVTPDLSDPHHGGRTVHGLTFAAGGLVYKPRGLGPEAAFARLLDWCHERGLSLGLRCPRVLDRCTHGWTEMMTPAPCADEGAARRFHRRAGMLLTLLHAFGSRDCHFENLIACGEHPVLVDLEAWLPVRLVRWPPGGEPGEAWSEAARRLERSVLSTGLLPQWQEGRRGELRNVGALGGGRPDPQRQLVWRAVNTDAMVRAWSDVETVARPNVPRLGGVPLDPAVYVDEVAAGLGEMYALLLRHRGELAGPGGPLGELTGLRTRLILRSTPTYRKLLARSLSPESCRDGAARSIELEVLARTYLEAESRPDVWPLLAAERQALEQGDVPLFLVPVEGTRVEVPDGEPVDGALAMSSLAAVEENLASLGEEDLRLQISFVRAALAPRLAAPTPAGEGEPSPAAATTDPFLAAAGVIAGRLRDLAVLGRDGSAAWIGPRYFAAGDLYELAVLGPDLYGGTAGIALFLAAYAGAAGDEGARELALRAIETVRRGLGRLQPPGLGGLTGIASIVYALVWIGEMLGEGALSAEALALSARLDSTRIAADRDLDVVFGSAGAILALLALDRVLPGPNPSGRTALEIAGECADHLLARQAVAANGRREGWRVRGGPPLAGFAHGASGIGYALLRLSHRTGRSDLRDAAVDGLAFEEQLFSPAEGNWQNPRRPGAFAVAWCHGAPGIALARLAALDLLDRPQIRHEIAIALATTRRQPLAAIDQLCCGNLGRAEVLLEASSVLGDEALLVAARDIAARVLRRSEQTGRFGCVPMGGAELTDPSLFRGEAGIGFTLLRLAGDGDLPCLLRMAEPSGGETRSL